MAATLQSWQFRVQHPAPRAREGRAAPGASSGGPVGAEPTAECWPGRGGRRRGDVTSIMPLRLASAVSMSVLSRSKKTARTRLSPIASAARAAREPPRPHRARARPAGKPWGGVAGSPDSTRAPRPREHVRPRDYARVGQYKFCRRCACAGWARAFYGFVFGVWVDG